MKFGLAYDGSRAPCASSPTSASPMFCFWVSAISWTQQLRSRAVAHAAHRADMFPGKVTLVPEPRP